LFGGGFEIETELTVKALDRGYRILEVPVTLAARPEGSHSKIRIGVDGMRILHMLLSLVRDYKPLTFFGCIGLGFIALGLIPGMIVITEFLRTGLVPRLPSAVLAAALVLAGMLSITAGLVLHTIVRRAQETEHQIRNLLSEVSRRRND
jgi:hypothetical protein